MFFLSFESIVRSIDRFVCFFFHFHDILTFTDYRLSNKLNTNIFSPLFVSPIEYHSQGLQGRLHLLRRKGSKIGRTTGINFDSGAETCVGRSDDTKSTKDSPIILG